MKRKLQLQDIAGYLPYGLKTHRWGDIYDIVISNVSPIRKEAHVHTCLRDERSGIILRPMSDLTKEITHNGETFVPIVELAKMSDPEADWVLSDTHAITKTGTYTEFYYSEDFGCFISHSTGFKANLNHAPLFDKIHEWFFDYRGLIDAGLAVSTETINPY